MGGGREGRRGDEMGEEGNEKKEKKKWVGEKKVEGQGRERRVGRKGTRGRDACMCVFVVFVSQYDGNGSDKAGDGGGGRR